MWHMTLFLLEFVLSALRKYSSSHTQLELQCEIPARLDWFNLVNADIPDYTYSAYIEAENIYGGKGQDNRPMQANVSWYSDSICRQAFVLAFLPLATNLPTQPYKYLGRQVVELAHHVGRRILATSLMAFKDAEAVAAKEIRG